MLQQAPVEKTAMPDGFGGAAPSTGQVVSPHGMLPAATGRWVGPAEVAMATAVITIAGAFALSTALQIPFKNLTRDPASAVGGPFYSGYLSQLGGMLWCATAAISLFSAAILRGPASRRDAGNNERATEREHLARLLWSAGLLSAVMFVDDIFMVHDGLLPALTGRGERVVMALLAVSMAAVLWHNRLIIRRTNWTGLAMALVAFGVSIAVDRLGLGVPESARHLAEDGAKFAGIAGWCGYYIGISLSTVRSCCGREAHS